MKNILIIGAGPAGLTAAYELISKDPDIKLTLLEATDRIGGISCTINHNGNRIDIGGHRFFSKSDRVMKWWMERMPVQGKPASDDKILNKAKPLSAGGPDPEEVDRTLLIRERISRIFYLRKFFDYPISIKLKTLSNLGISRTVQASVGYLLARMLKREKENSLEDFLINRFGKPLYRMFFECYTEKVWGVHPRKISTAWGAQRIKGLSLSKAIFSAIKKSLPFRKKEGLRQKSTETSLIEQFLYPKLGPGQLWECVADDIRRMGANILMKHKVTEIEIKNNQIVSVIAEEAEQRHVFPCNYCLSTMPIKDLIAGIKGDFVEDDVKRIAHDLPYRDFMTIGVLVNKLKIKNETRIHTIGDVVPDTWIYIQEPDVKLCRLQIFNNWSPYMVKDPQKVWIGLEYMCSEEDAIWKMTDQDFINFGIDELVKIGMIDKSDILDTCRIRMEKAYPAYFGSYNEFNKVKDYLNQIPNLFCLGRNGQHRYNNQDHSMLTAMEAVKCIQEGITAKSSIWGINAEQEYHEEKN